jgi:hypothetical protein
MKSYFLRRLNGEQKARLDQGSISYYDFVLGDEQGVIVQADVLATALDLLALKLKSETASQYEGIMLASLQAPATPDGDDAGTTTSGAAWKGKNQEGMTRVVSSVLMPFLRKDIVVDNPGVVVAPVEDGKFYVHIFSTAGTTTHSKSPATIWGITLDCATAGSWSPTGTGHVFYDGSCAVAELIGNNLYIMHNLVSAGSAREEMLLAVILERVIEKMQVDQSAAKAERLFVDIGASFLNAAAETNGTAAGHQEDARELKKELKKKLRQAAAEELKLLRNERLSTDDIFAAEYDALLRVPKVKDVQVENGEIIVSTELLFARNPGTGRFHEIGEFKIYLSPSAAAPRWMNQTRQVNGTTLDHGRSMQGVHIWHSGSACLGNTAEIFKGLFQQREWALAAQIAIEFAESCNQVNNDAAGMGIRYWPLAAEGAIAARDERIKNKAVVITEAQVAYRAKYATACAERVKQIIEGTLDEIAEMRKEIERLQQELVLCLRSRVAKQRQAASKRVSDRQQLSREFKSLLKTAKVSAAVVRAGTVSVWTDVLSCQCPKTRVTHEIGKFRIDIHLDGRADGVRWYNLSRQLDAVNQAQQAPRVLNSGRGCISELREAFPDLLAELKLSVLVQLAIEFIEQMDSDEPTSSFLKIWPEAS